MPRLGPKVRKRLRLKRKMFHPTERIPSGEVVPTNARSAILASYLENNFQDSLDGIDQAIENVDTGSDAYKQHLKDLGNVNVKMGIGGN